MGWQEAQELQEWVDRSRLNLMSGLEDNADRATVGELQGRFFTAVFPALEKLNMFAAQASPQERARMYEPAATVGA